MQTTHRTRRCPYCGEIPRHGYGADKGVPDLLITREEWPEWTWLGLEVKSPKGSFTSEQRVLREMGRIAVARSLDDAVAALEKFEKNLCR